MALIAWDLKANFYSCSNGAKLTGTYPCSDKYLKENLFTSDLPPKIAKIAEDKEPRKTKQAIDINCIFLTNNGNLTAINEYIKTSEFNWHLKIEDYRPLCKTFYIKLNNILKNKCFFFDKQPKFYDIDSNQFY